MRALRYVVACLFSCVAALLGCASLATAGASALSGSFAALGGNALVIPDAQTLLGGQQLGDAAAAREANPELLFARERSRTEFSHLAPAQAIGLAARIFPGVVEHVAGGSPQLPSGVRLLGYASPHAERLSLPGNRDGLLESVAPIALPLGDDRYAPIDLALHKAGDGFSPRADSLGVQIPTRLSAGVGVPRSSVWLTPVDAHGAPLNGLPGVLQGASVIYADTQAATDMLAKPTPTGFGLDALLRGSESPEQLFFKVGMPPGAHLLRGSASEAVRVVLGGRTLARVLAPTTRDAAEVSVPTSMSILGDVLVVSVAHRKGSYQYPIDVDPEIVIDKQLVETSEKQLSNWEFKSSNESKFGHEPNGGPNKDEGPGKGYLETTGTGVYAETEKAYWAYQTKGDSKIYEFVAKTEGKNKGAQIESFLELEGKGGSEEKRVLSTETNKPEYGEETTVPPLCAKNGSKNECVPAAGSEANAVRFQQSVQKAPSNYKFMDKLTAGEVYLSEPSGTHSTVEYNRTKENLEGEAEVEPGKKEIIKRKNVLDGSGWLSKREGAIELVAKDPGIGVSRTELEYESAPGKWERVSEHKYYQEEHLCKGVQCRSEQKEIWVVTPTLANGEDRVRYRSEDEMPGTESLESEGIETLKVDTAKPRRVSVEGLPGGNELTERQYELTVTATDGEGSTVASSGIRSIALYVDGHELEKAHAGESSDKCQVPKGECTATAKYIIKGEQLGAGHHAIVMEVFDNAGNETREEETLTVHHSTPVPLGPGSVNLQSGDFALSSTDVSMGSGLNVARAYSSRDVEEGDEGPLGPQWSFDPSESAESLVELVDHSMLLTGENGQQTIFAKTESSVYESPTGDSNLKLTVKENEAKTEKLSFLLENAANHSSTKFNLPSGDSRTWVPTVQEGAVEQTDTVTSAYRTETQHVEYPLPSGSSPTGITAGPRGDLWVADYATNKIDRVSTAGTVSEYSLQSGSNPEGIAAGPEGQVWSVNRGASSVTMLAPTSNENYSETTDFLPAGSVPTSIVQGSDENLWFTDYGTSKIGTFSSGLPKEFSLPSGSNPYGIVSSSEGFLWFTDQGTGKIGKISTSTDAVTEYSALPAKSEPRGIAVGSDNNIWFAEYGTNKIGKLIPSSGEVKEYSLPSGSQPNSITAGPDGSLWFTEPGSNSIGRITTSGKISEYRLVIAGSEPNTITTGPDGNLWFTEHATNKVGTMTPSGVVVEPTEVRAPQPKGVKCEWKTQPTEMAKGCRALEFKYDTEGTTAKGEAKSEWGNYLGRLERVSLVAYNPASGIEKMQEIAVAEYTYDVQGRLRAEWDPRVAEPLKVTYGYDAEGHVTAITPPGQQPWLMHYGTTPGDESPGRLLSLSRPNPSTAFGSGVPPVSTAAPALTLAKPREGESEKTSNGTWSNSPLAYSYQWEVCSSVCTPIPGATNESYDDISEAVRVAVTATNSNGSATAYSSISSPALANAVLEKKFTFGAEGEKEGEVKEPAAIAVESGGEGDVWIVDSGNNRIEKFTASGTFVAAYGKKGKAGGQFEDPVSIAFSEDDKYVYVADAGNKRIEVFEKNGKYKSEMSLSTYGAPAGIGIDKYLAAPEIDETRLFVDIPSKNSIRAWEVEAGVILGGGGLNGSATEPTGFAVAGGSELGKQFYVTDRGGHTIERYRPKASAKLSEWYEYSFGAEGSGEGQYSTPESIAIEEAKIGTHRYDEAFENAVFVADTGNGRVQEAKTQGKGPWYEWSVGSGHLGIAFNNNSSSSDRGYLYVATTSVTGSAKISVWAPAPTTPPALQAPEPGTNSVTTLEYHVPLSGASTLPTMTKEAVAKWAQKEEEVPVEGTSILPPDSPQTWPASSYTRATTYYLDSQGRVVNVAKPSSGAYGSVSTTEYNEANESTRTLTPDNRATALEAGEKSAEQATLLSSFNIYSNKCTHEGEVTKERESTEFGTRLCESKGPVHEVKYTEGKEQKEGLARARMRYWYDENVPGEEPFAKETFDLLTESESYTELVESNGKELKQVEPSRTVTSYSEQSNEGWKLRAPTLVTTDAQTGGKELKHMTVYNTETGQVTETRSPAGQAGGSPHDSKMVYYTPEAEAEVSACRSHPEWAGLVCETFPAKQPETSKVPNLPVTQTTYDVWDQPETVTETVTFPPEEATSRTKKNKYDSAGRLTSSETTVTGGNKDKALPKVEYEYEAAQGAVAKQTAAGSKVETISDKFNSVGQLTEYSDGSEQNATKFVYGGSEYDSQLTEVSDSSNGGKMGEKSRQTYTYNKTTMQLEKLWDAAAETFTATYDTEGRLLSEVYPNAMCANYTYNSAGEATHLEYVKTATCSEKAAPVWYSESVGANARGDALSRTSTLATENYAYDTLGRLVETQETPSGGECNVRLYGYEAESNRTSMTSRKPGSKGECAVSGGVEETHKYDEANRMTDAGIEYESLGNVTKLPANDAEKHELITGYYVDGAVASQTQNGVSNEYAMDPAGRTLHITSGGKTTIDHYDASGGAVAWSCEEAPGTETCESGKWSRNVPGIDGALAAVQTNGGTPVLQLHDLAGDVIATAALSSSETKLLSTYNSTEFGVPNAEKTPPSFAWLGAEGISKSLASGVITYGSTSYVPQTGRALQSARVDVPGFPIAVGGGEPYVEQEEAWVWQGAGREAAEAPGIGAAEAQAAAEAAMRAALAAAGEGEDPTVYLNREEAREMARRLSGITTLAEVADFAISAPEGAIKFLEGLLTEKFDGVKKAIDWFKTAGENLLKCAKEWQVCKFSDDEIGFTYEGPWPSGKGFGLEWVKFKVGFINLLSDAKIEGCTGINPSYPGLCFKSRNF